MIKYIFHIDMDTYFVSCERTLEPKLINKPIAIAHEYKRSIAAAISNELKEYGFKSGDSIGIIKKKVKDLIVIHPNYSLYTQLSYKIFNFLMDNYTKQLEIFSIDECYLEINLLKNENPISYAKKIQLDIWNNFRIPCSIGISFSKFFAKMSTNKAKPHGILWTKKEEIKNNFYDLDISKVFGIGKASSKKLNEIGIYKYCDLLNYENKPYLKNIFGKNYIDVINQMNGSIISEKLNISSEMKGMGNQETFMFDDVDNYSILINKLKEIAYFVSARLQFHNYEGNVISIQFRNIDKHWVSFQKKINNFANDSKIIFDVALKLFELYWKEEPLRGIGIRVSNLKSIFKKDTFIDLFEDYENDNIKRIIKSVNQELGNSFLKTLGQLSLDKKSKSKGIKFIRENVLFNKNENKEYK